MLLQGEIASREDMERAKRTLCKRYSLSQVPTNSQILSKLSAANLSKFRHILVKKPSRSLSGVTVVSVMTEPHSCPHGKCAYCPGGLEQGTPQSYTGREPAAMRAGRNGYDPYKQVKDRLNQLKAIGHPTDKIDLVIMGGTFTSLGKIYRENFVKRCFDALNNQGAPDLEEAHLKNERAGSRCVGLTIETRPDCFGEDEIEHSLKLGATRVELGVQTTYDRVLDGVNRGHGTKETKKATLDAKEAGLKVCYHIMTGLPGMTPEDDLEAFKEIFENPEYRPDMLKIYPTVVVEGTRLWEMWKSGAYRPYDTEVTIKLIAQMKTLVPDWVRIQRIQRDIPIPITSDGVKKGHIRELAKNLLRKWGSSCKCIRCREVGRAGIDLGEIKFFRENYNASRGKEWFLSFEEENRRALIAYARLRLGQERAYLRQLKVFGNVVPFNEEPGKRWQHRGYGQELLQECEDLAKEGGYRGLYVTSGVGVRNYYRNHGYVRKGFYMFRNL